MRSERPHLSRGDLVLDAIVTFRSQPGRALALGLAVALGVATFVAITSLSTAANRRTAERIDQVRPELVRMTPLEGDGGASPLDDLASASFDGDPDVRAVAVVDSYGPTRARARLTSDEVEASLVGADADLIAATRALLRGQQLPARAGLPGAHLAMVGAGVADRLALGDPSASPAIWIEGVAFTVIGVIEDSTYLADLIDSIVVPRSAASSLDADLRSTTIYLRTRRGAAVAVADDAPLRLSPHAPESWSVEVPRAPIDVSESISADLRNLTLAVSALVMAIGAVAIGNATMRSVYERTAEFGLRRALGARAAHIVTMVVLEATIVGAAAGALGVAAGSAAALVVSAHNGWPASVGLAPVSIGLVAATAAGVLAGLLPGVRAVQITPSQALRRD